LAHLCHIDHAIKQSMDLFLVLLQDIGHLNHIVVFIEEGMVEHEFQEIDKLFVTFGIF
jgi:hypothetical protein